MHKYTKKFIVITACLMVSTSAIAGKVELQNVMIHPEDEFNASKTIHARFIHRESDSSPDTTEYVFQSRTFNGKQEVPKELLSLNPTQRSREYTLGSEKLTLYLLRGKALDSLFPESLSQEEAQNIINKDHRVGQNKVGGTYVVVMADCNYDDSAKETHVVREGNYLGVQEALVYPGNKDGFSVYRNYFVTLQAGKKTRICLRSELPFEEFDKAFQENEDSKFELSKAVFQSRTFNGKQEVPEELLSLNPTQSREYTLGVEKPTLCSLRGKALDSLFPESLSQEEAQNIINKDHRVGQNQIGATYVVVMADCNYDDSAKETHVVQEGNYLGAEEASVFPGNKDKFSVYRNYSVTLQGGKKTRICLRAELPFEEFDKVFQENGDSKSELSKASN